jgi:ribosomal protein S18 acetylase RimI-like enzyme
MADSLTYRRGSLEDMAQLKQLALLSYGQYADVLTPENWQIMRTNMDDDEKLKGLLEKSYCYVCTCNEKIVGMAHLVPSGNPWQFFEAGWGVIRMVGVDPEYTGRGIARQLTAMCIAKAKETNETTIALHTGEFMNAARYIYESLGFTIRREIDGYLGKRYWLYTLAI